ncbi:MAG: hypothetical protein V1859_10400 [archaeon]
MKKIFFILVFLTLLMSVAVLAVQGSGSGQSGGQTDTAGQPKITSQPKDSGNPEETGSGTQVTHETQNQGVDSQIQTQQQTQTNNPGTGEQVRTQEQTRVQTGSLTTESGKQVQVQTQSNNKVQLKSGTASAQTSMEMTQQQTQTGTKLQVKLSNGQNAEVKVMPDAASEKALERLMVRVCTEENQCQIELKEVGKGEEVKAAYEVKVQKQAKFLGLFKTKMQVQAQVDAENGEVIQEKRPWWSFLASDAEE